MTLAVRHHHMGLASRALTRRIEPTAVYAVCSVSRQHVRVALRRIVTIHPFDDGNGRIARAITDMALARSEHSSQRFYSMSAQIRQQRNAYYDMLQATQKGDLDITPWLQWFLDCLDCTFDGAENVLASVFKQARFWERYSAAPFNERQRDILNRLLSDFEGKLTSSKWAKLKKCSQDTALRDIDDLVKRGILFKDAAGGRSTSYSLIEV